MEFAENAVVNVMAENRTLARPKGFLERISPLHSMCSTQKFINNFLEYIIYCIVFAMQYSRSFLAIW